jgi:hypothetical protein
MRLPSSFRVCVAAAVLAAATLANPASAQGPEGRLASTSGPVSVRAAAGWAPLARGAALSEGQTLRTGARSQAELDLGPNRIGLDPDTVLRIDSANPAAPALALEQGRAMVLLRSLQPGQAARLAMPRGTVSLVQSGLYVIEAGDPGRPATVGVSRGMAQVFGPGVSIIVPGGQTGVVGGPDGSPAHVRGGVAEGFLADDPSAPLPQVVRPYQPPQYQPQYQPSPGQYAEGVPDDVAELPGGDALLREGSWAAVPEYGSVWYPPVAPGWSPYADPWGDYRPWGYTPWYYGTWVQIGPRWGWLPPASRYRGPPQGAWRGRPPPALAQPQRQPPIFAPPPAYRGVRPQPTPPIFGAPSPAGILQGGPPRGYGGPPPGGYASQPRGGPSGSSSGGYSAPPHGGYRPTPQGAPNVYAPHQSAPPPQAQPPIFSGRPPQAPMAPPPASYAPRPPMAAPPMAAPPPRAVAPSPSRRCGPLQTPC